MPRRECGDRAFGGADPTSAAITPCTAIALSKYPVGATPLDERFKQLDRYWQA